MFSFALPEKKRAEIRILAAGNPLFRNAVHLKHFDSRNSHNLQLFDISVTIREICMFRTASGNVTNMRKPLDGSLWFYWIVAQEAK